MQKIESGLPTISLPKSFAVTMAAGQGHTEQIGQYTVFKDDEIGRGAFGVVFGAKHTDGRVMAVKKIDTESHQKAAVQEVIAFYNRPINHDNIIQLFEIERPPPQYDVYIFMEFCQHGDLDKYFDTYFDSLRTILRKLKIMRQIANGISFLHEQAIAHRDIKPANILISGSHIPELCVVKISDFGLAKFLDPEGDTSAMSTDVGTLAFKAPEFHMKGPRNDIRYHKNVDVYAEGLTFLAMINAREGHRLIPTQVGAIQVGGSRHIGLEMHLRQQQNLPPLDVAPNRSDDIPLCRGVKEVIRRMTRLEPHCRPLAEDVFQLLTNEFEIIQLGQVKSKHDLWHLTLTFDIRP